MNVSGRYEPDSPPDIVRRFIEVCEKFKEVGEKRENYVNNREMYFNLFNSLEVYGDKDFPNYKIKGVGAVHQNMACPLYEINDSLLEQLEKRFGLDGAKSEIESLNKLIGTRLYMALASENLENSKHHIVEINASPEIIKAFKDNLSIAPSMGIEPIKINFSRESDSIRFVGSVEDFNSKKEFKEFLMKTLDEKDLTAFKMIADNPVTKFMSKIFLKKDFEFFKVDDFFQAGSPISMTRSNDGSVKINGGDNLKFEVNDDHFLVKLSELINEVQNQINDNANIKEINEEFTL